MAENNNGKFCDSCQKNVIDFSTMSDNDIIKTIHTKKGEICGRLDKQQINRALISAHHHNSRPIPYKIIASLFLLNSLDTVEAKEYVPIEKVLNISTLKQNNFITKFIRPKTDTATRTVCGIVKDAKDQQPLIGVSVNIKGTSLQSTANIRGKFNLNIPAKLPKKGIVLQVSRLGYRSQEIIITKKELRLGKDILISLYDDHTFFMGGIDITVEESNLIDKDKLNIFDLFR
ncbi:MAG: carboxypeptidase-like regulatory domain-containing protein [Pyrinomonadaceae bacterium]|nr:carboxypeptidase-like regulatory domain-containing protein [Sphingobacteriaceae bacterium]